MTAGRPPYLPGDPIPCAGVAAILRVDQAGEYGAVRIYDGQLAVMGKGRGREEVLHMAEQEKRHRETFDRLMRERRVRPTLLQPLWHVAGYALGAATALLGERAAMACTVAVEEVIDEHYADQAARLGDERLGGENKALADTIHEFRADELRHREVALERGATDALGYDLISAVVKTGSRLAIWLSTRL